MMVPYQCWICRYRVREGPIKLDFYIFLFYQVINYYTMFSFCSGGPLFLACRGTFNVCRLQADYARALEWHFFVSFTTPS
jgi:hypothetical protein